MKKVPLALERAETSAKLSMQVLVSLHRDGRMCSDDRGLEGVAGNEGTPCLSPSGPTRTIAAKLAAREWRGCGGHPGFPLTLGTNEGVTHEKWRTA